MIPTLDDEAPSHASRDFLDRAVASGAGRFCGVAVRLALHRAGSGGASYEVEKDSNPHHYAEKDDNDRISLNYRSFCAKTKPAQPGQL